MASAIAVPATVLPYMGELSHDGFRGCFNGSTPYFVLAGESLCLYGSKEKLAAELQITERCAVLQSNEPRNVALAPFKQSSPLLRELPLRVNARIAEALVNTASRGFDTGSGHREQTCSGGGACGHQDFKFSVVVPLLVACRMARKVRLVAG